MFSQPSLTKIVTTLERHAADIKTNKSVIAINVDLTKTDFSKISPLLYLLLNKFEIPYLISIKGIPFCLMPDAVHHLTDEQTPGIECQKDQICRQCKYLDRCPGWVKNAKQQQRPPAINDLPREIVFETTTRCNLHCPICFSRKNAAELPPDRIKSVIDECVESGIKIVRFTGGEPLLYNHITEALAYAKNNGRRVILNTNATLITKQDQQLLNNYVDDILISLQGFNQTSEHRLTQSKVDFQQKLHTIVQLQKVIPLVRLGTIISRTVINNFEKYCHLVNSLHIKNWELYRPMFTTNDEEYQITPADITQLMQHIKSKRQQGRDIMIANPLPFCMTDTMDLSHHVLTGAEFDDGHSRLVVDARGFLKPSYCIHENLGNTIKEAWDNPFALKMRSLDYLPDQCQQCHALRWCKGGSRHWAKIHNGSYFQPDPLMTEH